MRQILSHFKKLDWIIIVSSVLLVGMGLLSLYSYSLGRGDFFNFNKQICFFGIGFLLMLVISFFDWRGIQENSYLILTFYFLCVLALAGLFLFAPEIRGVRSWYKLGFLSLDPIEPTKIISIILLAKYFSKRHVEMYRIKHIFLSGFYILLPAVLIFRQPDLGSVIILLILWIGILTISGIKLKHFLILTLCGLIIIGLSWSFLLRDYQKERVISFFASQSDPLGSSWNQRQAKIAIGSGGLFGQGISGGSQTRYGFLPEPHTDFIFASVAEETGLMGVSVFFLLFLVLLWRIIRIAIRARWNFVRLFASGLVLVLFSQALVHIGMNLGILPVIGISLPLVSYGGSGLIITYIGLGIIQSIKTH